jgi:hypothetical protein
VTDFAPFARYDRQPRIPAAGSNAHGRISAGDGIVTPLGLDVPALHNALHHYRDRIHTLMHALEREGAVTRFSSDVPRILEELVTTVEVDATARDLPEGRERMSPLERRVLVPLLNQLRRGLGHFQHEAPSRAWRSQLESLVRVVAEREMTLPQAR